ncbi:4'-phosphopantetheinyl transferase superfamily protein [Spongiibacter taiwanensis]|uniref:4'-phosphopantetheinyl transferase family protein n=1 Tax=Spongiibacter taiwanensis TaxID=1748242 RepID=UPI002035F870|nr:4'-phosphopantetheinyl transferase superfamily protein [Spongiibacter taiwanensis]USA42243.1 4'-phosphopantetheinyl transferase superfamily protein [Spongiibacter taiwanensis]
MSEPAGFAKFLQPDNSLTLPDWPITAMAARFHLDHYRDRFFDDHRIVLPEARQGAVAKRRCEFFVGRYLAKLALLARGATTFHVPADDNRCPLWPPGLRGSISHTDTYAACVVADCSDIDALGIDIQDWMAEAPAHKLMPRILDPQEQTVIAECALPLAQSVSLCFSAKESIFKALYPYIGHHFGYAAATLQAIDESGQTLQFAFDPALQPAALGSSILTVHYFPRPRHCLTLLNLPRR